MLAVVGDGGGGGVRGLFFLKWRGGEGLEVGGGG